MHLSKKAWIAYLKVEKAPTKVLSRYTNFTNIFSSKFAIKFFKYTKINNYTIELIDDQQSFYCLIYSLGSVNLEIFKIYIKNNLVNSFIRSFKSPTKAPIFFKKKLYKSLRLYVNYQKVNNPTIKN